METTLASDAALLDQIETFCATEEIGVTTFGRLAIRDANLVSDLRDGRELRRRTVEAIQSFMANYGGKAAA